MNSLLLTIWVAVLLLCVSFQRIAATNNTTLANNSTNSTETKQEDTSYEHKKGKRCIKNLPYVWCIPSSYNKETEPWNHRQLTNSSLPWELNMSFFIFDVQEVNDRTQNIRLSMYFVIKWLEPRLNINEEAPIWDQMKTNILHNQSYIPVSPTFMHYLWYPDLEIFGMEKYALKSVLKDMTYLKIYKSKHIKYTGRVDITFSCHMYFDNYPFDSHECPMKISSFYSTEDIVTCSEDFHYDSRRQRSLQHNVKIEALDQDDKVFEYFGSRYAICGIKILLKRAKRQILVQIHMVSSMFVIVSWVSFIVKPEVVPARMGLLVTIFLVLINIFNAAKGKAPISRNLNAVDLYLIVCIGLVFIALMEFAVVLFVNRRDERKNNEEKKENVASSSDLDKSTTGNDAKRIQVSRNGWMQKPSMFNFYDRISVFVFPIFFIIFNVLYFLYYL